MIFRIQLVASSSVLHGQDAGCEAAIHAMEQVFADKVNEAMNIVDAFNCLNRQVVLLI